MQIYVLLTEKCNLSCSMCIRGKQTGYELDFEQFMKTDLWNEIENHDIVLTGGEPTLHKSFVKIVNALSSRAKSLTITTNGTTSYYIDEIEDISKVFFQVSLDGIEIVHDSIRGNGSFANTLKTIYKLEQIDAPYCIASVVSKKNIKCMSEMSAFLATLKKMKYWRISYEMPFGTAEQQLSEMMTSEEWNCFVNDMLKIVRFRMKIQKIFPFDLFDKNTCDRSNNRVFNCGSCNGKIYIYPDLTVYPCTCLTDFPLGNLNDTKFNDILLSDAATQFSKYTLIQDTPCNNCKYKKVCNGGCIGMSYHFFGSIGYGDARCPLLKEYCKKTVD